MYADIIIIIIILINTIAFATTIVVSICPFLK